MAAGTLVPGINAGSEKHPQTTSEKDSVTENEVTDPGVPRMTPATLKKFCKENQGYECPELNEVLTLHYKGFRKIEGLSAYSNVRSLFLECNGIAKIENLEAMPLLTSLYLQSNCIRRMENLGKLVHLQYLNLNNNHISEVENLSECKSLETLKLSSNKITDVSALTELTNGPTLKDVDISCNYIEDGDALIEFWTKTKSLPDIECVYIHHNPCSRMLKDSRRRLISSLPKLRWMDDRPVTAMERVGCEAWAEGGKEAEHLAKQGYWKKEKEKKEYNTYALHQLQEAHAARAQAQKEAEAIRDAERAKAAAELEATGKLSRDFISVPARPPAAALEAQEAPQESDSRAKMRAKVDALLASRRRKETQAEDLQPAQQPQELVEASPSEEESNAAAEEPAAEEEDQPFEWSGFRDRRLGRWVADFRYNFKKAAAALSEEFQSTVSEAECRARYGALCRPTKKAESEAALTAKDVRAEASRAAKDGPPPSAAAVDEVSKWWSRKIARGPIEGEGASLKLNAPATGTAQYATPSEAGLLADLSDQRADEALEATAWSKRSEAVPGPWDSLAGASALGSSGLFTPPPRSALHNEPEEVKANEAPASAPKLSSAQAPDLFELD
eukprot:CAMPEP_0197658536 /NCGR_PEP_ID=MMETSP1338-20131121/45295_1 /TAXON_ID=43686 ORGANISM="Pelagodinium beii, Strain RCC1491" /NCGR_SAMPLE_ID=MMETSP1338 /ASSEMBLY_ACC=CAM_ASM_000754 /LENGTH=616 /DNA_ID=CAMNT_0043235143 /DNA_START=36 /DNA_END=1886 /DNA_ORIENTATION=-